MNQLHNFENSIFSELATGRSL